MNVITTTRPTDEGEMLWCVVYTSSYYDNDCRGPGDVKITARAHVLARDMQEAIDKTYNLPAFAQARKNRGKSHPEKTRATIVTLESLLPAEELEMYPLQGRLVSLDCPEDASRFHLAVCLVPKS